MLEQAAQLYFRGKAPAAIGAELGLDEHGLQDALERIEAVVLLLTRSFPLELIPQAARMKRDEVEAVVRASKACAEPGADQADDNLHASENADEALTALDYWTSRWDE